MDMDKQPTVREIRCAAGLTQTQFAERFGIPKRTIENWETTNQNEKRKCPDYIRKMMCEILINKKEINKAELLNR